MIIRTLTILLVAQLALTAALYWPRETAPTARPALLDLDREQLQWLRVSAGEGAESGEVELRREAGGWKLASGLPADNGKVAALLDTLLGRDPGYAIANSEAAAARFEVEADNFQRLITLAGDAGDAGEQRVYLGSSPSFRKIHARAGEQTDIHVLDFNSYDAPANEAGWLDRSLLALRDVSSLQIPGGAYRLDGGQWVNESGRGADRGSAADAGAIPDDDVMSQLITTLAGLSVTGIASAEDIASISGSEPLLELSADAAGTSTMLSMYQADDRYFLRSSAFEALFSVSSYDAEQLLDVVNALQGDREG